MEKIQAGHVQVNGSLVTEPSWEVDPFKDTVEVEGRLIAKKEYISILLNKPAGTITTTEDEHADKTVMDLLPEEFQHLKPVGRLDKDTEGLLLLTNDGDLAYRLTHPKFLVDKTYIVLIDGVLSPEQQKRLEKGIPIEDRTTAPAKVKILRCAKHQTDFEITIHEGRKRQIRLMLEALGHKVEYLKRIRQGALSLGNLPAGKWRRLLPAEIERIKASGRP